MSDGTVEFGVAVEVSVEQIKLHATYIYTPNLAVDYTTGIRHLKDHRVAVFAEDSFNGELLEILSLIVCDLLTVKAKALGEVTIAIEEADSSHINATIGSLLDVVACEHTKTTGVDFEAVAETILHREIGDGGDIGAHGHLHIIFERFIDILDTGHELIVREDLVDTFIRYALKQHHGVLTDRPPEIAVEVMKKALAFAIPHPPEVL